MLAGLGKGPEAEQSHRQALAIGESLAAEFPAVPEYRQELAKSHNGLGLLLAHLGKGPEAEKTHRQALAIGEKLAAEFPAVPEYRHELAQSHNYLGVLLTIVGKPVEAEQHHRQALAIREKLAADFPAVPEYQIDPQQEQLRYRALRAMSRLTAGQVTEAVEEVAELSKTSDWNAERWYDFACVYAIASGQDRRQQAEVRRPSHGIAAPGRESRLQRRGPHEKRHRPRPHSLAGRLQETDERVGEGTDGQTREVKRPVSPRRKGNSGRVRQALALSVRRGRCTSIRSQTNL